MCQFLSNDTVTARKQHACSWCGQKIEAGSKYVRQFVLFDGDTCTNKFHPECDNAVTDAAHEEGGCFEFQPGENERPPLPHHQGYAMQREGLMVSEYIPTPSGWIAISITAVVLIIFWYLATKDDDPDGKA